MFGSADSGSSRRPPSSPSCTCSSWPCSSCRSSCRPGGRAERTGSDAMGGVGGILVFGLLAIFVYGFFGWVFTAIAAAVYNLAAGWVGGIEVQVEAVAPPPPLPAWAAGRRPPSSTLPPRRLGAARPDRLTHRGITGSLSGHVRCAARPAPPRYRMSRVPPPRLSRLAGRRRWPPWSRRARPARGARPDRPQGDPRRRGHHGRGRQHRPRRRHGRWHRGLDLLGLGTPSAIELDGTTVSADLDLEDGDARATFSAPGLLGLTGRAHRGRRHVLPEVDADRAEVPGPADRPDGADASGGTSATFIKGLTDLLAIPASTRSRATTCRAAARRATASTSR